MRQYNKITQFRRQGEMLEVRLWESFSVFIRASFAKELFDSDFEHGGVLFLKEAAKRWKKGKN